MKRRAFAFAFAFALSLAAAPAFAQSSPEEQARVHFAAGVNLLRDPARPRYDEAYAEFKQAHALFPSPKILANVALCAMKLERDAEAIDAYTRYLNEAKDVDPEERAQVERDLATLRAGLATIVVTTNPEGASILDTRVAAQGDAFTNVYGPIHGRTEIGVRRGHHVLRARFAGGREVVWEADLAGQVEHTFALPADAAPATTTTGPEIPAPPSASRPVPSAVYVAGGITLALGIGALATGIGAMGAGDRFERANDGVDPRRAEDYRSDAQTLNVATDVLLVGTLLAAGVTAYLFFTRPEVPRPSAFRSFEPANPRTW